MFLQFINSPWCTETLDLLSLFSLLFAIIIWCFPSKGSTKQTHHTFNFQNTKITTYALYATFWFPFCFKNTNFANGLKVEKMNGQSGNFILIVEISTNNQAWWRVGQRKTEEEKEPCHLVQQNLGQFGYDVISSTLPLEDIMNGSIFSVRSALRYEVGTNSSSVMNCL